MLKSKLRICKRLAMNDGGSQIAEAALVLPIVFMLLFAVMSFARAYNIYTTITYAAQEGARVANTSTCATCTQSPGDVGGRVAQVLQASSIDPSKIEVYTGTSALNFCSGGSVANNCTTSGPNGAVTSCTNVEINTTTRRRRRFGGPITTVTGPAGCGATVSFQYPYGFVLPFVSLNGQQILLKADVQMPTEE